MLFRSANVLIVCREARLIGGSPDIEYALEVELRYDQYQMGSGSITKTCILPFGLLAEEDGHFSKQIGPQPLLLPRYRVGSQSEFPLLLKSVMDDLYNAVGKPSVEDFHFNPIS